jgi:hypothetical protein
VKPNATEYWDGGRDRTERERHRSIVGRLPRDSMTAGATPSFAEVIPFRSKRERADRDR